MRSVEKTATPRRLLPPTGAPDATLLSDEVSPAGELDERAQPSLPSFPSPPSAWWRIGWYPVAVPTAFIVLIWSAAAIHPVWLLRPLGVAIGATILLSLALSALLRDPDRGTLAACAVVVGLVVDDLRLTGLLTAFAALIVVEGLVHRGRRLAFGRPIRSGLSILGGALLLVTGLNVVQNGTIQAVIDDVRLDMERPAQAAVPDPAAPDIVVILLDGYPGMDGAEALAPPGFDPEAFPAALEARGFDVQRRSRTNYLLTRLVLPAMFSGTHVADLPELAPPFRAAGQDARRLRTVTDEGIVLRILAERGYERTAVSSGWSELGLRQMDRMVDPPQLTELEISLLRVSGVGGLAARLRGDLISEQMRDRIEDTFAAGLSLAGTDPARPWFLFLHVPAPHAPMVFDARGANVNGGPNAMVDSFTDPPLTRDEKLRLTFDAADDVADRTIRFIDELKAARGRPPVIVVFSDHGSDSDFSASDPLGSDLNERTSNVLAVFTPDHPDLLPPGTTPINIFPRILNAYLGTALPVRADTVWGWRKDGSVLDIVEIDPARIAAPGE